MKKLLAPALALTMALSLTACGGGSSETAGGGNSGGTQAAQTAQTEAIEEHRQIVAAMRERDVPLIKRQMVIHTEKFGLQQQAMLERYPDYFSGMSSDRQLKDSIF